MKKRIISARWLLTLLFFLGIGLGIGGTVVGEDLLRVVRVEGGFNLQQDLTGWVEKTASYQLYTSGNGLTLRLYAGFDRDFLYLGFAVNDPFLSFKDDYSLDFNQSDHLRVKLSPSAGAQEAVTLYLLPTSKIMNRFFIFPAVPSTARGSGFIPFSTKTATFSQWRFHWLNWA